jgi:quercetin dioxygenase-like cupin family protein
MSNMNETEFRQMLTDEGYDGPFDFAIGPNGADTEHTHENDIIALCTEGTLIIEKPSGDVTCQVGDIVSYPAGEPHVEKAGPEGAKALVERRAPRS